MAKRDRDGDDEMADVTADPDAEAKLIERFLAACKSGDADTARGTSLCQDRNTQCVGPLDAQ